MHTRQPLTDEQREQRRTEQRELVKASIEQLRHSEGWQAYLRARRAFHTYSVGNVLLILHQRTAAHCLLGEGGLSIRSSEIKYHVKHAFARDRAWWWRWLGSVGLVVS